MNIASPTPANGAAYSYYYSVYQRLPNLLETLVCTKVEHNQDEEADKVNEK